MLYTTFTFFNVFAHITVIAVANQKVVDNAMNNSNYRYDVIKPFFITSKINGPIFRSHVMMM